MKRFLLTCLLMILLFACHKTAPGVVYDTHLFQQLQAHSWIFDSAKITDSTGITGTVYPSDTAEQITTFASQIYTIRDVRDTTILDSTVYQVIYDTPSKVYYYNVGEQVITDRYLNIDTVNEQSLVLSKHDTLSGNPFVNFYHAQ